MPQNPFDSLQAAIVATCENTFGYDAAWLPSDGSPLQTGRMLFREPTEKDKLGPVTYTPIDYYAEWFEGAFVGLYEAVRSNRIETITIAGESYFVRMARKAHDGKTYYAHLEKR